MTKAHHFAALSIAAALLTIALKGAAWYLTGSVGLLSDALESFVNLAGAGFAFWMLLVSRTPPDEEHPWGHSKAEYFSSGFEGTLIFAAAVAIGITAVPRLLDPQPVEQLGLGLTLSVLSAVINGATALILRRAGRRLHAVALEADARHLMTDVWTTGGVVLGVLLVPVTGWLWLDPVLALAVAAHILKEGAHLMRDAVGGLMDEAMSAEDQARVVAILDAQSAQHIRWHKLRTRRAGHQRFIQVDLLVPPDWTVEHAHAHADAIELEIGGALPGAQVSTHVEPAA